MKFKSLGCFLAMSFLTNTAFSKPSVIPRGKKLNFKINSIEKQVDYSSADELTGLEKQWYLFDPQAPTTIDGKDISYPGIGYLNLIDFISTQRIQKSPYRPEATIVAVIDSGTDINHEALQDKLWKNDAEINGKPGVDDDKNGYIDDYYGWNFIGKTLDPSEFAKVGKNQPLDGLGPEVAVAGDTVELTRNYFFLKKYKDQIQGKTKNNWQDIFDKLESELRKKQMEAMQATQTWNWVEPQLENSQKNLESFYANPKAEEIILSRFLDDSFMQMYNANNRPIDFDQPRPVAEAKEISDKYFHWYLNDVKNYYVVQEIWYGNNEQLDTRKTIVGDADTHHLWPVPLKSTQDVKDFIPLLTKRNLRKGIFKTYGNNDVIGTRNGHGTHVSGLIGVRDYTKGDILTNLFKQAQAGDVQIMTLRVVPEGDERDKDVANAITYAVDNGAHYINMSFGKAFPSLYFDSKNKKVRNGQTLVDMATAYARRTDLPGKKYETVLVHAAGNDSKDTSDINSRNFPNRYYNNQGEIAQHDNWIEIGASYRSIIPLNDVGIVADFSNYGKYTVDILSPGKEIYSTLPNNTYEFQQGTSMAAPIATGVLAELRSNFTKFSPSEIATITLSHSHQIDEQVDVPSTGMAENGNGSVLLKDYFIYDRVINIKNGYNKLSSLNKVSGKRMQSKKRFLFWKSRNKSGYQDIENELNEIKKEREEKYQSMLEEFAPNQSYVFGYNLE